MSLPERQQSVLDEIEQSLQKTDPGLRSMFAGFAKLAGPAAMPVTGVISSRRGMLISIAALSVLGALWLMVAAVAATGNSCPGLPSDQAVVSAAQRYAACSHDTAAWSKGGR
jgi:Protein of unknown function (DUF3040)